MQNGLKINEVTYQEEVKEGDMIVTSGLDGLKESLLVGRISEVKVGQRRPVQRSCCQTAV